MKNKENKENKENIPNDIRHKFDNSCIDLNNEEIYKRSKRDLLIIKKEFKNILKIKKLNKERIKIDTGFACNAKCYFCYYKSHLNDPYLSIKEIKNQIIYSKLMGFKQVEFSGGESTFHPEWFNMLKFAKRLKLKSSLVSNGLLLSNKDFFIKSKENGLNEVLFSVHGFMDNHDKMVGVSGAFKKIIEALKNAKELNIITRINITVNYMNLKFIPLIIDLLINSEDFNISQFNFIEINNSHEAFRTAGKQHDKIYESFKNLELTFDKILDYGLKKDLKEILNIRYLPYCKINKKYHPYIKNYIHHWFDNFDWCPMFVHRTDFNDKKINLWKKNNIDYFCNQLKNTRYYWYYKKDHCLTCEYNGVCDGYKKTFKSKKTKNNILET